jgi:hypothetical protein
MEKMITRILKKSLGIKYPFIDDVEVTKEKNHKSYFTDEEKNYIYTQSHSIVISYRGEELMYCSFVG